MSFIVEISIVALSSIARRISIALIDFRRRCEFALVVLADRRAGTVVPKVHERLGCGISWQTAVGLVREWSSSGLRPISVRVSFEILPTVTFVLCCGFGLIVMRAVGSKDRGCVLRVVTLSEEQIAVGNDQMRNSPYCDELSFYLRRRSNV